SSLSIKCIVRSAVSGLVEEECRPSAIGCRILFEQSTIAWYQPSHLYDRNQMVCMRAREYSTPQGCDRKPSGHIRCWCSADSDSPCNTEVNSLAILSEYLNPSTTPLPSTSTTLPSTTPSPPSSSLTPKRVQSHSHHHHHSLSPSHTNSSLSSRVHSKSPTRSLLPSPSSPSSPS
ncbi:hypothetical protein PMAYCL1PPCAC_07571, partial [Pristionchus mayeri]